MGYWTRFHTWDTQFSNKQQTFCFAEFGTISNLKEVGKFKTEGKDYIVQDGDIINVKFNI